MDKKDHPLDFLHSAFAIDDDQALSPAEKAQRLSVLLEEMEECYHIPRNKSYRFELEHPEVLKYYRRIKHLRQT